MFILFTPRAAQQQLATINLLRPRHSLPPRLPARTSFQKNAQGLSPRPTERRKNRAERGMFTSTAGTGRANRMAFLRTVLIDFVQHMMLCASREPVRV